MKRLKHNFKKGMAFVLSLAMVAGLIPAMSGGATVVKAETGNGTGSEPSVSAYATKTQLMDGTFAPNESGEATNKGKLVFGKNSSGKPQEWYILGKDTGVTGDNTIIFAASPIVTGQVFEDDFLNNKTYNTSYGVYTSNPENVYQNHYGASDLRVALQNMATDTSYFTSTEQGLMNATTVETKDTKNTTTYTTTDKLYALQGDYDNDQYLWAGTDDSTVLDMSSYWRNGDAFWLRSPHDRDASGALLAYPGDYVSRNSVNIVRAVQPASNLNLTNVLFASAARVPSSGTVEAGSIAEGTSMTLRLDGSGETIGIVEYNTTNDEITAQNDEGAAGPVWLVIQGKDGTNDWFYSVKAGSKIVVTKAQIEAACGISGISLSDCNIWLETTIDNITYAKMATETTVSPAATKIDSVAVTGVDAPVANSNLDTEAACSTTGIATKKPAITYLYTDENTDVEASGNADWNKSYKAKIILAPGAVGNTFYEFGDSVSVTVDGKSPENITVNPDGTLTVITQPFEKTAKRKIESVTAPTVPTTFLNYYGHEGYAEILTDGGNSELGTQATVRFEADVLPTTKALDVTWTIANDGDAAYDKTPGAENTFRWTIPASALTNYNATGCTNYDSASGTITGTVTITNKTATPVTITGTDEGIAYTGATVDVSQYFTIDSHAGTATYSDVTVSGDGKGVGTLEGSMLTVTQTGEFKIKVATAAKGIYAANEKTITLTVDNGTIEYTAADYSTTYDG